MVLAALRLFRASTQQSCRSEGQAHRARVCCRHKAAQCICCRHMRAASRAARADAHSQRTHLVSAAGQQQRRSGRSHTAQAGERRTGSSAACWCAHTTLTMRRRRTPLATSTPTPSSSRRPLRPSQTRAWPTSRRPGCAAVAVYLETQAERQMAHSTLSSFSP